MLEYRGISERGNSRKAVNQDSILMCGLGECGLFAVADGIGGLAHGDRASKTVTDALRSWWDRNSMILTNWAITAYADELEAVLRSVNQKLLECPEPCGSTISLLLIVNQSFALLNAGDSRIYMQPYGEEICQLTRDDVWENDSKETESLTEMQIRESKKAGKLTNAVGIREDFYPSVCTGNLKTKCLFLVMSDGIHKMISIELLESHAKEALQTNDLDVAVSEIGNDVLLHGASDNFSLIVVSYR